MMTGLRTYCLSVHLSSAPFDNPYRAHGRQQAWSWHAGFVFHLPNPSNKQSHVMHRGRWSIYETMLPLSSFILACCGKYERLSQASFGVIATSLMPLWQAPVDEIRRKGAERLHGGREICAAGANWSCRSLLMMLFPPILSTLLCLYPHPTFPFG